MTKEELLNEWPILNKTPQRLAKKSILDLFDKDDLADDRGFFVNFCDTVTKQDNDPYFREMMCTLKFILEGATAYTTKDKIICLNYPNTDIVPQDKDRWRRWYFVYCHECLHQLWDTFEVADEIIAKYGNCNHQMLNVASDCVINDYLEHINKSSKLPPVAGIFPKTLKEEYGIDFDRNIDTQFTMYEKLLKLTKDQQDKLNQQSGDQQQGGDQQGGQQSGGQQSGGQQSGSQGGSSSDAANAAQNAANAAQNAANAAQDAADKAKEAAEKSGSSEAKQAAKEAQDAADAAKQAAKDAKEAADKAKQAAKDGDSKKAAEATKEAADATKKAADAAKKAKEAAKKAGADVDSKDKQSGEGEGKDKDKKSDNSGSAKSDKEGEKSDKENGNKSELDKAIDAAEQAANDADAQTGNKGNNSGNDGDSNQAGTDPGDIDERELIEQAKAQAEAIIDKYSNKIGGKLKSFINQCRSSKKLEDRGLAVNVNQGNTNWVEQVKNSCMKYVTQRLKTRNRYEDTYTRWKRGERAFSSEDLKNGRIIKKGHRRIRKKLGFDLNVYIDVSGSMGDETLKNVFKAAYSVIDNMSKEFGRMSIVDASQIVHHAYVFTTTMREIQWNKVCRCGGGTYALDNLIADVDKRGDAAFINIILTDGEFSNWDENKVVNTLKNMQGLFLIVTNNSKDPFNDLVKKVNFSNNSNGGRLEVIEIKDFNVTK